jgi:hypothetical protein
MSINKCPDACILAPGGTTGNIQLDMLGASVTIARRPDACIPATGPRYIRTVDEHQ